MRREVRAARRQLAPEAREHADTAIRSAIRCLPVWRSARRVALFFAFDGEPDLIPLIGENERRHYFCPVITRTEMHFAALGPRTRLAPNVYGILEPTDPELIDPRSLDLVLTPLVAFDERGTRLGVGAGYYDRCFRFLAQRRLWRQPKLLGCAYQLQRRELIERMPWDIPLWGAVTEQGFEAFV